jgi:hypothetical protein
MSGHERERLSAYLDGELAPTERAAVTAHLTECAECAARLAELASVDEAASALAAEAPPGYFETLPARVRARLDARRPQRRERRLPAWGWAVAAALLLAVVTPFTLRQKPEPVPPPAQSPVAAPSAAAAPAEAPAEREAPAQQEAKRELPRAAPAPARAKAVSPPAPGLAAAPLPEPQQPVAQAAVADEPERGRARLAAPGALAASREDSAAGSGAANAKSAVEEARAPGGSEDEFQSLDARRPGTAEEWRRLREDWRRFASAQPNGPRGDEARVRSIEAGYEAWRAAGDAADEALFRRDASAYLARDDAAQKPRVTRLVAADESRR